MHDNLFIFSEGQGNVLIRLLLAHFLADFIFQTKKMVDNKHWLSLPMLTHIGVVYITTVLFTGWWLMSGAIAIIHYIIDATKKLARDKNITNEFTLFIIDQVFHIISLLVVWTLVLKLEEKIWRALQLPFTNYQVSLILLGYLIITTPIGFIIKCATQNFSRTNEGTTENGGKTIGIFERIIILTFVLLGKYEAIGFLITGKSIIRFANKQNEHIKSEYVLVGTMMSYALSILIGVTINWLLKANGNS